MTTKKRMIRTFLLALVGLGIGAFIAWVQVQEEQGQTSGQSQPESRSVCPSTTHVTQGALPASKKVYIGEHRVPMREIELTNDEKFTVYDTSGPYTDESAELDIMRGLPKIRREWITGSWYVVEVEGGRILPIDNG